MRKQNLEGQKHSSKKGEKKSAMIGLEKANAGFMTPIVARKRITASSQSEFDKKVKAFRAETRKKYAAKYGKSPGFVAIALKDNTNENTDWPRW